MPIIHFKTARRKHMTKTVTWRITATTTTFIITWLVTGSLEIGAIVGGFEAAAKMVLYYVHERAWFHATHEHKKSESIL